MTINSEEHDPKDSVSTGKKFERSKLLLGMPAMEILANSHICVAGIGGVGSFVAEALSRGSVGELTLIDFGRVEEHNINRQLYALSSTIGKYKTDVARARIEQINADCVVHTFTETVRKDNIETFDIHSCDALIDCIDDITAKIGLLRWAVENGIPVITSVMGASTRLNSQQIKTGDISQSTHCPVAKKVRKGLKETGIDNGIHAIYSTESPGNRNMSSLKRTGGTSMGSFSCLPGIFGLTAAQETINKLIGTESI